MIAVIDYGVGNLFSLTASLKYLGADVKVTGEKEDIEAADRSYCRAWEHSPMLRRSWIRRVLWRLF